MQRQWGQLFSDPGLDVVVGVHVVVAVVEEVVEPRLSGIRRGLQCSGRNLASNLVIRCSQRRQVSVAVPDDGVIIRENTRRMKLQLARALENISIRIQSLTTQTTRCAHIALESTSKLLPVSHLQQARERRPKQFRIQRLVDVEHPGHVHLIHRLLLVELKQGIDIDVPHLR